ncbi:SDR family oxidoreductase [uncultured Pontibacter sp.]|uniref:SDR family NAD(P)-dependent oxidoreductase n=1 Tax=uncultured Pontibacter sp. TaxID=453356 RepID=UPI002638CABA|nr:SDR family oxidoreductase [uncultured Pontibacter sp.]
MIIEKKYTLITGASAGIGKAMADECAKRGQNLVLVALQQSELAETASFLQQQYGVDVKALELNLTAPHAIQYLYDWCHAQKLTINVLINNAGIGNYSYFQEADLAEYQSMIKLNVGAVVALTHLFVTKLRENEESYILNVGSFASLMPLPYKSVYAATKSFVLTFSRSLQMELKPYNIHVSCLCPGPTSTNSMQKRNQHVKKGNGILTKTPEEVASSAIAGLFNKQGLIIPGWKNRFLIRLGRILPFSIKSYILKRIFKDGAEDDLDAETHKASSKTESVSLKEEKNSRVGM